MTSLCQYFCLKFVLFFVSYHREALLSIKVAQEVMFSSHFHGPGFNMRGVLHILSMSTWVLSHCPKT